MTAHNQNPSRSLLLHLLQKIPQEILIDEILPRLPVKSVSRFKCVSRSWLALMESDRFIKIQYRNSAKKPRVVFNANIYKTDECSLLSLLKQGGEGEGGSCVGMAKAKKRKLTAGTLVGCCNGVVCSFSEEDGIFSLWNPATGASMDLPKVDGVLKMKRGFGWDESSGAYKVFVVLSERIHSGQRGRVYSSNTNSWRTVAHGSQILFSRGELVGGSLHWVCRQCEIEFFDLGREEFGRIEPPFIASDKDSCSYYVRLGDIGGRLGMLYAYKQRLELWVMKEYGVKDSWFKLHTFPIAEHCEPRSFPVVPFFGEAPNGDIFMVYGRNLMLYSPNNVGFIIVRLYSHQ